MHSVTPQILSLDPERPDETLIEEAVSFLARGELAILPTETVYGLACRVKNESLEKLSQIKGREHSKRYTLHIGDKEKTSFYVPHISLRLQKLIEKVWPGPLTIVFELDDKELEQAKTNVTKEVFENTIMLKI